MQGQVKQIGREQRKVSGSLTEQITYLTKKSEDYDPCWYTCCYPIPTLLIFSMTALFSRLNVIVIFTLFWFSVYPWLAATTIVAKPKRCDLFANWLLLVPMG